MTPDSGSGEECHPAECGYVTPGEWSGGGHPGDYEIVSPVAGLGKGSP